MSTNSVPCHEITRGSQYKNYTEARLQEALRSIRAKTMIIRDAAEKYGISRSTLFLKLHGKHNRPPDGQTVLIMEEEQSLISHVIAVSVFGFPVTAHDLRFIVKAYLDKRGEKVKRTSLMICGNAAGELAPVYVVYKSENLWQSWTENGPENCRYNRTKSRWFDYQCFEDWFVNTMLPMDGKKILIGDNLSSHLNVEVIRQCEHYNVSFIALPPNATQLVQPLDVILEEVCIKFD